MGITKATYLTRYAVVVLVLLQNAANRGSVAYADPVCTCGAGGPGSLIYKPDYENDCTRYSQYVGEGEPSNIFIDCAADLIFDVVTCNCNYRYAASCDPACKDLVCEASTCSSQGECVETATGELLCICDAGFTGDDCSQNIDDCSPDPCGNGGSCTDGDNTFTCSCTAPWTGATCQEDVVECDASTCLSGGTCVELVGGGTFCQCPPGYTGANCCQVVTVTWYTQESRDNNTYRIQEDIPRLDAMTACFRYKPVNSTSLLESRYIFTISDDEDDNRFRLGFRNWGEFGISRTYFSDGTDDEEVFDLWREEHKHCFVWRRRPDEFKWFVDNDTDSPGDLVLFRTVSRSRNERTRYGSTLVVFQDQDSQGSDFEPYQTMSGSIAQLNIYNYAMPDDTVMEMKMFCGEKGNIVNDDTLTTVGTMETETEDKECKNCSI